MDENVASAGTYPSEAVHRHLGIGDDLFGRLDDQRAELAACAIVDQKDEANRRARHEIDQPLQLLGCNWFTAIRTAVRVSSGNHIEERSACGLPRGDRDLGGENRLTAGRGLEPSLRRLHIGSEPEGTSRAYK